MIWKWSVWKQFQSTDLCPSNAKCSFLPLVNAIMSLLQTFVEDEFVIQSYHMSHTRWSGFMNYFSLLICYRCMRGCDQQIWLLETRTNVNCCQWWLNTLGFIEVHGMLTDSKLAILSIPGSVTLQQLDLRMVCSQCNMICSTELYRIPYYHAQLTYHQSTHLAVLLSWCSFGPKNVSANRFGFCLRELMDGTG